MFELSVKLKAYKIKIENETGRTVLIKTIKKMQLPGMSACFRVHPKYILVEIVHNIPEENFERSVAHEITHGFLAYKKKYCRYKFTHKPDETEINSVSILGTMIEDIVVNKIIYREKFQPYASNYLNTVQDETKYANKGKDCYQQFKNPLFKNRIMIFKYIMAWGFLEYFELDTYARRIISKFTKTFQKSYPEQYKDASQVEKIILKNNIFTAEGYHDAIKECIALWNLGDLGKLITLKKEAMVSSWIHFFLSRLTNT